jgi:hypothetical protein
MAKYPRSGSQNCSLNCCFSRTERSRYIDGDVDFTGVIGQPGEPNRRYRRRPELSQRRNRGLGHCARGDSSPGGVRRGDQAPAPIRQRARMEYHSGEPYPQAAFQRRSKVNASAVSRSDGPCNACSTRTEPITGAGADGTAPQRREEVLHYRIREQPLPMFGQKSENTARSQQLPGQCLHIQIPALRVLPSSDRGRPSGNVTAATAET